MRRLISNAVLALLVAYALLCVYAAACALWQPFGTIGLSADYGGIVRAVAPGSPAALAGIVPHDRILLSATPFGQRRYVAGAGDPLPIGEYVHVTFVHFSTMHTVELRAVPYVMTTADRSTLGFACVAALLFIVVGATVIARRPSSVTWGFGLYCLTVLPTEPYSFVLPSANLGLAFIAVYDIAQNLGVAGLLLFALEFPRPIDSAWRRQLRRSLPVLFVVLSAMTLYPDIANLLLGTGARFENHLLQIALGAAFALAMFVLWDTYKRIAHDDRERMRWVIVGFTVGLVANYIGNTIIFSSLIPIEPPNWLLNVLVSLNVLLPLSVAHAVVRHRVLDIDFVIGRALVYGILTAAVAGIFALLDWFFGYMLEEYRLSHLLQAAMSIVIALTFNVLHKRTERVVEAVFFRGRRVAEVRLERLAHDLLQARTVEVVEKALVDEAVDALTLTSGAFFRNVDGRFTRTAARGWRENDCASLDDTDLLVLALRANERAITLAELPWRQANVPTAASAAAVALGAYGRTDLTGIVLYGGHSSGGDIDPTELVRLERLTRAAGVALDQLDAERLRAENATANSMLRELRARLEELRRLQSQRRETPAPIETGATAS